MSATINLSTMPGHIEDCDGYRVKTMQLGGAPLGREAVTVSTVADIAAAVQAFGTRVRAVHPDSSFRVLISMKGSDRKPRGYDRAYLNNGFRQEDFLRVVNPLPQATAIPADIGRDL